MQPVHEPVAGLTYRPQSPAVEDSPGESNGAGGGAGDGVRTKRRRTRNGCLPCRKRKKLCDEVKPACGACTRLALDCEWEDKMQAALERRTKRLERQAEREREQAAAGGPVQAGVEPAPPTWSQAGAGPLGWPPVFEGYHGAYAPAPGPAPGYNPASPGLLPPSSLAISAALAAPVHPVQSPWMPFLGSLAPAPAEALLGHDPVLWPTSFPIHQAPYSTQPALPPPPPAQAGMELDADGKSASSSPPFDLFSLLRSPSPTINPFASSSAAATLDGLNLPFSLSDPSTQLAASHAAVGDSQLAIENARASEQALVRSPERRQEAPLPLISQAASFLASSDFAFTQSYLLSHYTTSLARLVSIASTTARATPSSSGSSSRATSSNGTAASTSASSARASANLFLSLVPLAQRHAYLLHAICAWSAANLAAASSPHPHSGAAAPPAASASAGAGAGGNPVMTHLSEQLGTLADAGLAEALPALEAYAAARTNESGNRVPEPPWEAMLAARLMQTQAAICSGSVELWRVRMRDAATIIELVGGVRACRTPLARQLVKNLLYHDVLSSSATRDGLLVDYAGLARPPGSAAGTTPGGECGASGAADERARQQEADEEDEEDALDTLMGVSEAIFLIIGRITHLAKEKRQAVKRGAGAIAENELEMFLRRVEEIKRELEREKERMDGYLLERPDLEPHRYFHETFRLSALLYCEMLLEQPPRAFPVLLLVRKMLSLTELIVSELLPGLPSMHYPLFLMHLNATPLLSPNASITDRERSTRLFLTHQEQLGFFGNTKRSATLIDEAWRRSSDGRAWVDADEILGEWGWELNYA